MTIEQRLDKIEASLGKQDALVVDLRDAVTVTVNLELKHGRMMKDHAEWLVGHDQAMQRHDEAMTSLDKRISDLVSGIGEFMRRDR